MGSQSYENVNKSLNEIQREQINLKIKINKDIIKREEKERKDKIKYELNIYIYSNIGKYKTYINLISNYNNDFFNWEKKIIKNEFSKENSDLFINEFINDFEKKNFKNVLIIPIDSISEFIKTIKIKEKNILEHFNILISEQQPFFIFYDYESNDFTKKEINPNKESINAIFLELNRKEIDFEISIDIIVKKEEIEKIQILKSLLINKKKRLDEFEMHINDNYNFLYQIFLGEENMNLETFFGYFYNKNDEFFNIHLQLINQNSEFLDELKIYEKIGIINLKFILFYLNNKKLYYSLEKYSRLDKRNFNIIRGRKSPKNKLIKYTGYYNQFGDILFCEQSSYYPSKINIAIGGFIGSGKSTLINTIFGEKRCLEAQGCSQTNYISEYTLKDYALNFIDFPGFRAKRGKLDNISLFIGNIESKITNFKRTNEIIHCFLFCIKFEERIFDANDDEMKNIFNILIKYKIKTFFVVTQSEEPESENYKKFKEILIVEINKVKRNYSEDLRDSANEVLGKKVEDQIIPIRSVKKNYSGIEFKPFGLDILFQKLYDYFSPKKIVYEESKLTEEDKNIQELIDNNKLLKPYQSKKQFLKGLREKVESEISKFILKYFLVGPKYLYTGLTEEIFYKIVSELLEHFLSIYKYTLEKNSIKEKIKMLDSNPFKYFTNFNQIKNNFEEHLKKKNEFNNMKKDVNISSKNIPIYLKILFPILSPIYYVLGGPLIFTFSGKISKKICDEIWSDLIKTFFLVSFLDIIESFNKGIDDLKEIKEFFEDSYKIYCRFCNSEIKKKFNGGDNVCNNEDCKKKFSISCKKILECGHKCPGIDGDECLPCINKECEEEIKDFWKNKSCNICNSDLINIPIVKLSCGHYVHFLCLEKSLENKWMNSGEINIDVCQCRSCKEWIVCRSLPKLQKEIEDCRRLYECLQKMSNYNK